MADIRAKIAQTALAKTEARLSAMTWDTTFFDRIVPRPDWEQLAGAVVRPAFDEFVALNAGSWWCQVVEAAKIGISPAIISSISTNSPEGGAIRFSTIFGIIHTPAANDPYCALFYDGSAQRAFWVTQLWTGDAHIDPVALAELTIDGMLTKAQAFATRLLAWEHRHPPVAVGFEPYPRYGIAA